MPRSKLPCVYIMSNQKNGTLYTGVTSNLRQRIHQHKNHLCDGFTQKYKIDHLVYYETHQTMEAAIVREKHIKKWKRQWKIELIEQNNPEWCDLYDSL